jgi:predicted TIM-barrel fold metal-dependent hydrolase
MRGSLGALLRRGRNLVSDPTVVDMHVHVFPRADDPMRDGYEIWEYGTPENVEFGKRRGTVEDLMDALDDRPYTHCVILGMFIPELGASDDHDQGAHRGQALPDRLQAYNAWILETAALSPRLTPLVAADPSVLGGASGAAHLRRAVERGARGIKVHPVLQRFMPADPRMEETYAVCEELELTVLSHSGVARQAPQWADPFAFADVMRTHPRLRLVLAHLGGAGWHKVSEFAAAFPSVAFDLCEIIAWTGSPGAPTADQLGRLIRDIGADRVLFGTDFPWYELDRTIDQLMSLPHLSDEERRGILGENAVRRLGLDVAEGWS